MSQRETFLKWGSITLLILSIYIIYYGMQLIQNKVDNGEKVSIADHSKSDTLILFGSMMFGVSGGMLTNIFTVYDNSYTDMRFDKIEAKLDDLTNNK